MVDKKRKLRPRLFEAAIINLYSDTNLVEAIVKRKSQMSKKLYGKLYHYHFPKNVLSRFNIKRVGQPFEIKIDENGKPHFKAMCGPDDFIWKKLKFSKKTERKLLRLKRNLSELDNRGFPKKEGIYKLDLTVDEHVPEEIDVYWYPGRKCLCVWAADFPGGDTLPSRGSLKHCGHVPVRKSGLPFLEWVREFAANE